MYILKFFSIFTFNSILHTYCFYSLFGNVAFNRRPFQALHVRQYTHLHTRSNLLHKSSARSSRESTKAYGPYCLTLPIKRPPPRRLHYLLRRSILALWFMPDYLISPTMSWASPFHLKRSQHPTWLPVENLSFFKLLSVLLESKEAKDSSYSTIF